MDEDIASMYAGPAMDFEVEFDMERDGRWIAGIAELPGVLAYGDTREEARTKAEALARQIIAEQSLKE
jgi:predicted RNase H-like HicB family nuclease